MPANQQEFTRLIQENRGIIFKVIRLYVNDYEEEKDLYQEILFQSWKSYERFNGLSKFSTWLYRVSLNTVLTYTRNARNKVYEDIEHANLSVDERSKTDEAEALYVAIRQLNEIDRMIITLHLDGYENEEIAEITGLTKNNVAVKMHRTKDLLIKKLKAA
ncbi:MAG TPA: sigma-70 family RNA polymerase sigma factor [Cyclobacteriaceae bacterium]|nr:sigma-70 family RNA polymerase sigma factor [Cyclobacteriaceae bacterium]